jgi:hypothetical protein
LAMQYYDSGVLEANSRGPGRYRAKIWDTPFCTPFLLGIGDRIVDRFQLAGYPVDPQLGWIISLLQPGSHVHTHRDRYPYHDQMNALHLRCNIMVCKDHESGNPVIDSDSIDVQERGLWAFFPSEVDHSTALIQTTQPRICYQFGFVVPNTYSLEQYRT